jgi:hypothetical protein
MSTWLSFRHPSNNSLEASGSSVFLNLFGPAEFDLKGRVTVSGHPSDDVHPKTLKSILTQARVKI